MHDPSDEFPREAVAAASVAACALAAAFGGWFVDDAGIAMAYAARVAEGSGFVPFRGGPVVEGFSDPLWVLALAAAEVVGVPATVAAKILGFGVAATIPAFAASYARRLGADRDGVLLVAWFLALSGPVLLWSVSGLEAGALALALLVATGGSGAAAAVALAAVASLRPEGPALALAAWGARSASERRFLRGELAVVLSVAAAVVCWRFATFGAWWPNTAAVKLDAPLWARVEPGLRYVAKALLIGGGPAFLVGAPRVGRAAWPALVPAAAGLAVAVAVGGDWMPFGRFVAPVVPLLAVAALPPLVRGRWGRPLAILAVVAQIPTLAAAFRGPPLPMALVTELGDLAVAIGPTACGESTASFAGPDVGGLLWAHPDVAVSDLAGLTDPLAGRDWPARLATIRPQVVVTHGPWASITGLDPATLAAIGYRASCARQGTVGPHEATAPTTFWLRADCVHPLPDDVAAALLAWCHRPR